MYALVTGASSGIGLQYATVLAEKYKNTNIITDFLQYARDNADNYDTNEGWSLADLIDLSIKYSEEYKLLEDIESLNNGWIPCSERLPEEDGKYLVSTDGTFGIDVIDIARFENDEWFKSCKIIAWQTLPEPYKEGDT